MSRRTAVIVAAVIAGVLGILFAKDPKLAGKVFSLAFVASVIATSVPYVLAGLCGAITERSGVVDLAIEAKLLFGAFTAASVAYATGSVYAGVLAGALAGLAIAAIQLFCALRLGADQVIVGVALNILALGGTRFLLQLFFGEGANTPQTPGFSSAIAGNPLVWLTLVAAIAVPIAVQRTRWGLRLRAAGDRPDALVSVGVAPARARYAAGLLGGALCGAGGAQLSLSVFGFTADVSGGRGYMVLAMVILAGWRAGWTVGACLGIVAAAEAFNIQLQVVDVGVPRELAPLLPHIITMVVLFFAGGRIPPPRSLGRV